MTECYDYLFEVAVKMRQLNLDPGNVPPDSEYKDQVEDGDVNRCHHTHERPRL